MIKFKDVAIVPYRIDDGIPNLPNSFFFSLFDRIMAEGAAQTFYLLANEEALNKMQFTRWCQYNHFYFVYHKEKPAGFTVVTEIRTGFGYIDIYLFKEHWGSPVTDEARDQATEWLLTNEWNALISFIPTDNKHMVNALHKIRWKDLGVIPQSRIDKKNNKMVDQLVGYSTRGMYQKEPTK